MDRNRRDLERAVAADSGDVGGRQALTVSMLRSRSGVAAWWPGTEKPHPAALKTAIGGVAVRPDGTVRRETVGWLLAVTTASDVLEIAALRGGCRLIDLATLRTVGLFGESGAVASAAPRLMASTVDALGRPRASASDTDLSDEVYGRMLAPDELDLESGTRRLISESLWDSEVFLASGSVTVYPLFANTRSFAELAAGMKSYGLDVNLTGQGGNLPILHSMVVNGISLLPSTTVAGYGSQPLPQDVVRALRSSSYVRIILGGVVAHDLPSSKLVPLEPGVTLDDAGGDDVFRITGSAPAVYPFSVPFVLHPLLSFQVDVVFPDRHALQGALRRANLLALKLTCVLHGSRFAPLAA